MAEIIQLAKDTLKGGTKTEIYPKTSDAAVATTDSNGNATTLDNVLIKSISINGSVKTPTNNSINLGDTMATRCCIIRLPNGTFTESTIDSEQQDVSVTTMKISRDFYQADSLVDMFLTAASDDDANALFNLYIIFGKTVGRNNYQGIYSFPISTADQAVDSDSFTVDGVNMRIGRFDGIFQGGIISGVIYLKLPANTGITVNTQWDVADLNILISIFGQASSENKMQIWENLTTEQQELILNNLYISYSYVTQNKLLGIE